MIPDLDTLEIKLELGVKCGRHQELSRLSQCKYGCLLI